MTGIELIAKERERQIEQEDYTSLHDDKHRKFELTLAAMSYCDACANRDPLAKRISDSRPTSDWPWDVDDWKPSDNVIRNLVKAGALIAAEIDRLQRRKDRGDSK